MKERVSERECVCVCVCMNVCKPTTLYTDLKYMWGNVRERERVREKERKSE